MQIYRNHARPQYKISILQFPRDLTLKPEVTALGDQGPRHRTFHKMQEIFKEMQLQNFKIGIIKERTNLVFSLNTISYKNSCFH
jgi:hypothetical protein